MEDRRSQPALLVVILALLGLSALPRGGPSERPATKSATTTAGIGADSGRESPGSPAPSKQRENPDLAVLGPLIDLADDGAARRIDERDNAPKFDGSGRKSLVREVIGEIQRQGGTVRAMTALLPDPVHTSVSQDFDSVLDGLQRAAEAAGFVLARSRFPWDEKHKSETPAAGKPRDAALEVVLPDKAEASKDVVAKARLSYTGPGTSWGPKLDDQPGLLLFQKQYDADHAKAGDPDRKRQAVLVVFLVLETPTRGLRKHQLNWSLDLLDAIADAGEPDERDAVPRPVRILGPHYTGTQTSLNHALNGWLTRLPSGRLADGPTFPPLLRRAYTFSLAASATEVDFARIKDLRTAVAHARVWTLLNRFFPVPAPKEVTVEFRPAANRRNDATDALLAFLDGQFGGKSKIALLVESNTVFGARTAENRKMKGREERHVKVYNYLLHIASLRSSYEKQGLLRDLGGQVFRSAGSLELPQEDAERLRDVVASATFEFSTRVDELVMVQTMTDIARGISQGRYDGVGITGTSSRDIVFLAQMVRKYCPDVVIFTPMADLLFTQPQTISDLRGMLVGSTYPLYAPNRLWSYPYGEGPEIFFNKDGVQAVYNAAMGHLREIFHDLPDVRNAALPIEFSLPFRRPGLLLRPPIWIGVVGNRGIYPLRVSSAPARGPDDQTESWFPTKDLLNEDGTLTTDGPTFFQPSYHVFWKILELCWLMAVALAAYLVRLEIRWTRAVARKDGSGSGGASRAEEWPFPDFLHPLAESLFWIRARSRLRDDRGEGSHRLPELGAGPGPYLVLGHLALFLIYLASHWPFFASVEHVSPWTYLGLWDVLAWVQLVTLFVSLVLSVTAWRRVAFVLERTRESALIAGAAGFVVLLAFWLSWEMHVNTRLALERIVVVTSGVSPTFPLLFVGLGTAACLTAQVRRRYLNKQITLKELKLSPAGGAGTSVLFDGALAESDRRLERLRNVFHKPSVVFHQPRLVPTLLLGTYLLSFGTFVALPWFRTASPEGWLFRAVFGGLFLTVATSLAFSVYSLVVVWDVLKEVLERVARLPLTCSFIRLPERVARWFFEQPIPKYRSVMIAHQAAALAGRCDDSVRDALNKAFGLKVAPQDWAELVGRLRRFGDDDEDPQRAPGVSMTSETVESGLASRIMEFSTGERGELNVTRLAGPLRTLLGEASPADDPTRPSAGGPPPAGVESTLLAILTRIWEGMPLSGAFADGKPKDDAAGRGWMIAPTAAASLTHWSAAQAEWEPVADKDELPAVRDWAETAEDFIALQLLRHLSHALAQLWVIIGFVVTGSLSLLLAINSYTFPMQDRTEFFLALLIAVAAFAILRIVLDVNRDETISRVANSLPGRFTLNRDLVAGMAIYILPLIGILAAISYDVSDLLRVWLDPVFRILS